MAFRLENEDTQGLNEINLIPLIDVMLVLMIIFLVTATVINPSIQLNLPETNITVNKLPPEVIQINIDKNSNIYWDNELLTLAEITERFTQANRSGKDPSIQLKADKESRYETVAQVLAEASSAKLTKIAFVTE